MLKVSGAAFYGLVIAILTSAAGAAPARADDALIAAAKREGEVMWYTGRLVDQFARPIIAAFEKKYPGIKVNFLRTDSQAMALRIMTEARAGKIQPDVIDQSTFLGSLLEAGLIGQYDGKIADKYPAEARDTNRQWIGMSSFYITICYNTDMVKAAEAPKNLNDLLDPKWKGKMAWTAEPNNSGPPGLIGVVLSQMGEKAGMEYLRKLAAQNIVNIPANTRVVLDQTIAGERPLALLCLNHHAADSKSRGAPVEWVRFDPMIGTMTYLALLKNSPHPNAGKLLYEFILSSEGQRVAATAGYIPMDPDVPALVPDLKPAQGGFTPRVLSLDETSKNIERWVEIYDEIFK